MDCLVVVCYCGLFVWLGVDWLIVLIECVRNFNGLLRDYVFVLYLYFVVCLLFWLRIVCLLAGWCVWIVCLCILLRFDLSCVCWLLCALNTILLVVMVVYCEVVCGLGGLGIVLGCGMFVGLGWWLVFICCLYLLWWDCFVIYLLLFSVGWLRFSLLWLLCLAVLPCLISCICCTLIWFVARIGWLPYFVSLFMLGYLISWFICLG